MNAEGSYFPAEFLQFLKSAKIPLSAYDNLFKILKKENGQFLDRLPHRYFL